jgi:hypothetical protein
MLSGAANTVPESFAVNLLGRIHIIFSFPGGYFLKSSLPLFSKYVYITTVNKECGSLL